LIFASKRPRTAGIPHNGSQGNRPGLGGSSTLRRTSSAECCEADGTVTHGLEGRLLERIASEPQSTRWPALQHLPLYLLSQSPQPGNTVLSNRGGAQVHQRVFGSACSCRSSLYVSLTCILTDSLPQSCLTSRPCTILASHRKRHQPANKIIPSRFQPAIEATSASPARRK
jgi:hypothetical protein